MKYIIFFSAFFSSVFATSDACRVLFDPELAKEVLLSQLDEPGVETVLNACGSLTDGDLLPAGGIKIELPKGGNYKYCKVIGQDITGGPIFAFPQLTAPKGKIQHALETVLLMLPVKDGSVGSD